MSIEPTQLDQATIEQGRREAYAALEKARASYPKGILNSAAEMALQSAETLTKNMAIDEARLTMAKCYLLEAAEIIRAVAVQNGAKPASPEGNA